MASNVIYRKFGSVVASRNFTNSDGTRQKITRIFLDSGKNVPPLLTDDISQDIRNRINHINNFGQFKIITRFNIRRQSAHSDNENLQECKIKFFLQTGSENIEAEPFMILEAKHQKHSTNPNSIKIIFSLKSNNESNNQKQKTIAKGNCYNTDIARFVTQQILRKTSTSSFNNTRPTYEAWTPP